MRKDIRTDMRKDIRTDIRNSNHTRLGIAVGSDAGGNPDQKENHEIFSSE